MRVRRIQDAGEFLDQTLEFRASDLVTTHLIGRAAHSVLNGGGSHYEYINWWVLENDTGQVTGIFMRTAPFNVVMSNLPIEAIPKCVEAIILDDPDFTGINAPTKLADKFLNKYRESSPTSFSVNLAMSLHSYLLKSVLHPPRPIGDSRLSTDSDFDVIRNWLDAFISETGIESSDTNAVTKRLIESGRLHVWEVDGRLTSMASYSQFIETPTGNVASVGGVYTPIEERKNGYASSLVADVSQLIIDQSALPMLYTDAKNPTSNKVYTDIGYEFVQTNNNWDIIR